MTRPLAALAAIGGILLIAAIDFASGVELRVFPLYYLPIALAAWCFGRGAALAASGVAALAWFGVNQLAGLEFSHPAIWLANTVVQGASFSIVGLLVARLHGAVIREQAISRTDPLCGVLNSRAFYDEGGRLVSLCRRTSRPITLAYIDVDNFKSVNDRGGHEAGDALLRTFAGALQQSVRASDVVARLGGDEFAVLLPELGAEEAGLALRRLHAELAESLDRQYTGITISLGAATFLAVPADVDAMVREADRLMYDVKRGGKNCVRLRVFGPSAVTAPNPV